MKTKNNLYPLIFIGTLFLMLGVVLGINTLLIPYLKKAFQLTNAASYLMLTAAFSAFVIFSYPSGLIIKKIGYKNGIIVSFALFALGLYLFIPSASLGNFPLFLGASFILGMGNTLLQTAMNPYVTILGPIESAAKRICAMTICNRAGWAIAPVFLSLFINLGQTDIQLKDIYLPFKILVALFLLVGILTWFVKLPEVKATGEDASDQSQESLEVQQFANTKKSVFQFPHLIFGVIAMFFYAGIDALCLVSVVDFAQSLGLSNPERYTTYSVIGISLGCVLAVALIPKHLSQLKGFRIGTVISLCTALLIPVINPLYAIYLIPVITFSACLTWGNVWPLSLAYLGKFTKAGSSLLVSAVVGAALLPLLFGYIKDKTGSIQTAYWIFVPAFLFIAFYAFKGYKAGLPAAK